MGEVIIRIQGYVTGPSPVDGTFVKEYTADGYGGRGRLIVTPNREEAKQYANAAVAMETWKSVSMTHPKRIDGEPNRPLTAYTVEIEPA